MTEQISVTTGLGGNKKAIPVSALITYRLAGLEVRTPPRESFPLEYIQDAINIYYRSNTRFRKSTLILCMAALAKGLRPVRLRYHKADQVCSLHCVDDNLMTPNGEPWPVVLDAKYIEDAARTT